jgi:hypothetical protein
MTRARDIATQGGLVLLNTTSFTAQSTVSFNNVFSATYANYKVIYNQTAQSATSEIYLRLRNAGVDRTNSAYFNSTQGLNYLNATVNSTGLSSVGVLNIGYIGYGDQNINSLEFFNPFDATQHTVINGNTNGTTGAGSPFAANTGIFYQSLNSNDGFTIYTGAGNISGTVRIYGIKN